MKRYFILSAIFASFTVSSYAQGEMDAFNLSYNDLTGTARSVAMGGAFGALGGDISGIAINPAGIGVYKTSEVVTTMNFANTKTKTDLLGVKTDDSKFKFSFDNLAFVGTFPLFSDDVPFINFGFSYNRLKSFDRQISLNGNNLSRSQADYIANRVDGIPKGELGMDAFDGPSNYWFGALALNGGLIDTNPNTDDSYHSILSTLDGGNLDNTLYLREKGAIDSYDFNVGTTFADFLSIGATLSVTDINYRMYSSYGEDWYDSKGRYGNYFLDNALKTDGTGWQVKVGAILKPVKELRIGVSYHSPTWYEMTDYYSASIDAFGNKVINSGESYTDYKFRTPDKWTFSLAGIIGQVAIISADYELTNYGNMHLSDRNGRAYTQDNQFIKQDFKNSSTLRVGAEVRFTPQFSGRVGYMWQQSPVKESFKDNNASQAEGSLRAATAGTATHYALVGDANYFTYGLGYKFTPKFYADIAFVMKNRKDDLYTFGGSDRAELKTNTFNGLLTLGVKF